MTLSRPATSLRERPSSSFIIHPLDPHGVVSGAGTLAGLRSTLWRRGHRGGSYVLRRNLSLGATSPRGRTSIFDLFMVKAEATVRNLNSPRSRDATVEPLREVWRPFSLASEPAPGAGDTVTAQCLVGSY
jgi:hypothetical protein